MSDGFFVSAHYGKTPTTYVHLDPEKGEVTIKSPTKITIDAPQIELKGAVTMGGAGSSDTITLDGSIVTNGNISTTGNVSAGHFYGPVN
jgi:phage baseplate assembly protein gpV